MSSNVEFAGTSASQIEMALCRRLEEIRLSRNIMQSQLAVEAGVSTRTIRRMEAGEGITLDTFIRVLMSLGMQGNLAALLPDESVGLSERDVFGGRERKRASASRAVKTPSIRRTLYDEADTCENGTGKPAAVSAVPSGGTVRKYLPWHPSWSEIEWDQSLNARLDALTFDVIVEQPRSAEENLALDEALLYSVAEGRRGPTFWMWDWSERSVVLGSYQSVSAEFNPEVAQREGFSFARRISGGGAMVVEPERTITYSLIVPESVVEGLSFRQSFAFLDMWVIRALRGMGIPASYRPINDIVSPVAKIGGAAQCRRRHTVLHHVTMAYAIDGGMMWDLLQLDTPRISEKGVPSAVKKVSPLSDFTDQPHAALRERLAAAFAGMYRAQPSAITPEEWADARDRIDAKFSTEEWRMRVE
jgi:lipoate-protein ligase A